MSEQEREREGGRKCKSDLSDVPEAFTMPVLLFSRSFHVLQSVSHVSSQGSIIPWHVSTVGKSSSRRFSGKFVGEKGFILSWLSWVKWNSRIRILYQFVLEMVASWFRNYLLWIMENWKKIHPEWFSLVLFNSLENSKNSIIIRNYSVTYDLCEFFFFFFFFFNLTISIVRKHYSSFHDLYLRCSICTR